MKLTMATLCEFAQVRDSVLFIASGNITMAGRQTFPTAMGVLLATSFIVEQDEVGNRYQLGVTITTEEGEQITSGESQIWFSEDGTDQPGPIVTTTILDLTTVPIPKVGHYRVVLSLDGVEQLRLPIEFHAA